MISIVCPFYNEKENLKELCERILKIANQFQEPWELILVNDGSTDGGAEMLQPFLSSNVRILSLDNRYGLTTALYAGLQASKGDILATLDADLQNPPEEIPKLLGLLKDVDMVTGVRKKREDGPIKRISSKIANHIRRSVLGDTMLDVGCSLRVFKREVLRAFYPYHGMHRFFAPTAEAEGFKVKQVPVEHHLRLHGKSKYGLMNRLLGPLYDLFSVRWMLKRKIRYQIRSSH